MSQGTIWASRDGRMELFEVPDAGRYIDPTSGWEYELRGFLGFHTGPGYAMTGWPVFWKRLVPVEGDVENKSRR